MEIKNSGFEPQLQNFIKTMGKDLGHIDMHLLASALLAKVSLWTLDKRLNEVVVKLELAPS